MLERELSRLRNTSLTEGKLYRRGQRALKRAERICLKYATVGHSCIQLTYNNELIAEYVAEKLRAKGLRVVCEHWHFTGSELNISWG